MTVLPLFVTPLISVESNLDLSDLEQKCLEFRETHPNEEYSNVGGYQSSDFTHEELDQLIHNNIPIVEGKPIKNLESFYWVNINGPGHCNLRHHHDPHSGMFLSGVFYVKVPENSGAICFYDPRPHINTAPDMVYYNGGAPAWRFYPKPNTLILFPSWLEHSVEVNKSSEERISIAFNLFNLNYS